MHRQAIERWTDTMAFSCLLYVSGVVALPILALGVVITIIGAAELLANRFSIGLGPALFAALSIGGVLGCIGYVRAVIGSRKPERHNITATLVCLTAGVATALVVAGLVVFLAVSEAPWSARGLIGMPALFAVANLVWAIAGVGWMQRLPIRYSERTGRAFDGMPAMLLVVAIALATAVTLTTMTL